MICLRGDSCSVWMMICLDVDVYECWYVWIVVCADAGEYEYVCEDLRSECAC